MCQVLNELYELMVMLHIFSKLILDKVSCTASDVSAQGIADLQITNKAEDRRERKWNGTCFALV